MQKGQLGANVEIYASTTAATTPENRTFISFLGEAIGTDDMMKEEGLIATNKEGGI